MNATLTLSVLALLLSACSPGGQGQGRGPEAPDEAPDDPTTPPVADAGPTLLGEIELLTYNVAGLPEPLSGSNPDVNTAQMSPLLNDYAMVLVQEDFGYHDDLAGGVEHPHQSEPMEQGINQQLGDGLNRFSMSAFTGHTRHEWEECNGTILGANDCLTPKGFAVATHTVAGVEIDVYNLHMDAGRGDKDRDARAAQVAQIVREIDAHSADRPMIVAGDTNMHEELDDQVLADFLSQAGIVDACQALACGEPSRIDRVFVRGTDEIDVAVSSWALDARFVDADGEPLSDHKAVSTSISITRR